MGSDYQAMSKVMAGIIAALTFFGSWIYCIAAYGFLLGVGLGWLPSLIVSAVAWAVGYFVWPLILFAAGLLILALMGVVKL